MSIILVGIMTLVDLIKLLENKLSYLLQQKSSANQVGDVSNIVEIERQEMETQNLLSQLKQVQHAAE